MRFEIIIENNSVDKKDCFQQKSIKIDAADKRDAAARGNLEAEKLGSGWKILYIRELQWK